MQPISPCDIFRWPDGTTCYRCEWQRGDYEYMSDDFEVIPVGSPAYAAASGEAPCVQSCASGPAELRAASHDAQAKAEEPRRPFLPAGTKVWRVGNGLKLHGPAPRCPQSGHVCANWRTCYECGCQGK